MREAGSATWAACLAVTAGAALGLAACTPAAPARAHRQPSAAAGHRRLSPGAGRHPPPAVARRIADPAAWARSQAHRLATRILAGQAMPAGARRLPAGREVPRALRPAISIYERGHRVRIRRIYIVPSPEAAVIGFLRSHFPAGTADDSYGAGGTDPELSISYRLAATPDGVQGTLFFAGVLPDGQGRTWLRADAMVDWCLPRTPAEHIDPARYRAVVVTSRNVPSGPKKTRRFTGQPVIAELARQFNALHTVGTGYYCLPFPGGDQVIFQPKSRQAPMVALRETSCDFFAVTVGGKGQPTIGSTGHLLRLIDRLTGIT